MALSIKGILSNWPSKLAALVLAIAVTSYVHWLLNPSTTVALTAQVRAHGLRSGLVSSLETSRVPFSLSGPKAQTEGTADSIRARGATVQLDLSRLGPGQHKVRIAKLTFPEPLPDEVSARLDDDYVEVRVEQVVSRSLPVSAVMSKGADEGWTVEGAAISPDKATLSGASSLVYSVQRLAVLVKPNPAETVFDQFVQIRAYDSKGSEVEGVRVAPDVAHVVVKVVEAPATKAVFVSPSVIGQPQYPARVTDIRVSPQSVTVRGTRADLERLGTLATDDVDIAGATQSVVKRVAVRLPAGVEAVSSQRVTVTVNLQWEPTSRAGEHEP